MRTIVNISLPEATAKEIRQSAQKGGFASVSEYMRHLVRQEKQRELAQEILRERVHFDQGKGKVLRSLRDLK